MIAPTTLGLPQDVSLRDATDEYFKPGGKLEQASRLAGWDYEPRPQQREMALAVADSLEQGRHLAVEAGTGVGKSFAYLIPIILHALRQRIQLTVSTYTISLQEQLMYKDVPFIRDQLGLDFKAVLVKGRANYLCLRRLARYQKLGGDLFAAKQQDELETIRAWALRTADGSLQDMKEQPSPDVWSSVCVEHGNCLWQKCPEYKPCFFMNARAQMRDAQLLIVNHHLFFSDQALKEQGASLLPESSVCVLDEAHAAESVASDHMGLRLSQYAFEHWMRRLYVAENNKGLFASLKKGEAALAVSQLGEELDRFFEEVKAWAHLGRDKTKQVVTGSLPVQTTAPAMLGRLTTLIGDIAEELADEDVQAELKSLRRRGLEMREALDAFIAQTLADQVYWVEAEGTRRRQVVLYSAPIEVAATLSETLFKNYSAIVMTSATLSINGKLDYFKSRIGAEDADSLSVGSPFDYSRQMRIFLPAGMPDPSSLELFTEAATQAIRHYVDKTKGHAFVLFTSDRFMRSVADKLREHFFPKYPFLVQGGGMSRNDMLEKFRETRGSVLFGLGSFWMGVDVKGEALSNVIITKLPFAVPDEPVVKARMDRIKERGGDPFRDYSLPEAILKFRQGVGRLIRSQQDQGIVVILDPRVRNKWYGRHFLDALPECPVQEEEIF